MSFVLFHLSDFHLTESATLKAPESVNACLRELATSPTDVCIVISGDIAFSGRSVEYEAASSFLSTLKEIITRETSCDPKVVVIPGNHDCLFPQDSSVRDLVLAQVRNSQGRCESIEMLRQCLDVQHNFFSWAQSETDIPELETEQRICWTLEHRLNSGQKVVFLCINSAWLSSLPEVQGRLFFPIDRVPEVFSADIVVSVLHHPYNWFEAMNARSLRRMLEETSDVILTGHEHEAEIYKKSSHSGAEVNYLEGGVFHTDTDDNKSGFSIILFDVGKGKYQVRAYFWDGSKFSLSDGEGAEWRAFVRNAKRKTRIPELTDDMSQYLRDPGAQLTHKAKAIELEDIYVTPNLKRFVRLKPSEGLQRETVESDYVINRLFDDRYVYLGGDGQCGKTGLAKMLYFHALHRGLVPVLIKGRLLNHVNPEKIQKTILGEYSKQYVHPDESTYAQLASESKVVILDDFFDSKLNREAKAKVCEWLGGRNDYVFVFGGDLTHVEEIIVDMETGKLVSDFVHYEIMEFGYLLRARLVEKWLSLGSEHLITEEDLAYQVKQVELLVNTVLGKNLLPAYPIFVLVMLQQFEAAQPLNTSTGAYGYFYELLITRSLQETSTSVDDVDMKYNYLSELAWHMFSEARVDLDVEDIENFNARHWIKYRLSGSAEKLVRELQDSLLVLTVASGYSFRYKYLYYYFVARYMRDNLSEPEVIQAIDNLVESLHRDDCANIIIFLTYLSRDRKLIERVLTASRNIYADFAPCDLDEHVSFVNKLQKTVPQILLPEGDPVQRKKAVLRQLDIEREAQPKSARDDSKANVPDKDAEKEELEDILALNKALKSMQITGQILRNFSGSLKGDLKLDLAKECFSVGLRSLSAMFGILEKHLDGVIGYCADLFGKNFEDMPEEERVIQAKQLIFFLTEMLFLGTVKRISVAVGSERLMPTYDDVKRIYHNSVTEFIQTAIRLDHSKHFPEKRVLELKKSVKNNLFGETLLRMLVADHFYLFPRSFRTRQKMCVKLGIKSSTRMIAGSAQRKRRK